MPRPSSRRALARRRSLALPLLLALAAPCATNAGAQPAPAATAQAPSAAERRFDFAPVAQLVARIREGTYGNVDHLVVVRDDSLLFDERFPRDYAAISRGHRSALGCGIDACADSAAIHPFNYLHPRYHPWWEGRGVHTLQSVTKSVTATLIGITRQRGEIRDERVPLLSFFGAYDLRAVDPRLRRATLADLLTMRSGIEWHESDRPLDETNTTVQLERSSDWIRFTLAQPMDAEPGTKWAYNSGGSQLMAAGRARPPRDMSRASATRPTHRATATSGGATIAAAPRCGRGTASVDSTSSCSRSSGWSP